MHPRLLPLLLLPALLVSACSLEPRYERPDPAIAPAYPRGPSDDGVSLRESSPLAAADLGWRDFFADPFLQQLVQTALVNNRDLRIAVLNVAGLQAQLRIQTATLFPQAELAAEHSRSRTPADLSRLDVPEITSTDSVVVAVAWEIDLFGRLRSLRHSALEQYLASIQGRRAAQILLVSQVAAQYLSVLACDELLEVTQRTLESARSSYDLAKLQFDVGEGSELDLRQAETVVELARANRAEQWRARAQAENGLRLLLGQAELPRLPRRATLSQQQLVEDLPAGLPSALLIRRPDVLQAEALLRSANADIGAARAAFFPTIDLTGSGGTASAMLSGMFDAGSAAWTVAPSIGLPFFEGGANRAALEVARVRKEIAIAGYQRAVQTAFREVADSLAARATFDEQIASLTRLVAAQQRRLELARLLYRNGESSYLDVLTAQTDLYDAQLVLVAASLARLTNLVTLYSALGGGWIEHTGDHADPLP
ncbi:efflux transporter outer membrane subunit [Povalibacter sp.]|uniref:efflux transporter outer membrane subunit n=1 Tax=Povalibacter sp. TaxID=1962978 RepID=UPI002F404782